MALNDLFRMVSLRHSKPSPNRENPDSAPDPRLGFRHLLEGQAEVQPSPREAQLLEMKKRQAELSGKVTQLEAVQRAVMNAYMLERQEIPVPREVRSPRGGSASRAERDGAVGSTAIIDRQRFIERVDTRLDDAAKVLFKETIDVTPDEQVTDVSDLLRKFDYQVIIGTLNSLCTEIRAVEENVGTSLPTVQPQAPGGPQPIVAAVGWGDLVVARESLVGYDAREIAHIENILPGESKLREHQRLSRTEEVQETEIITEKETEKDSQTTDRYELHAESRETINRDFSISTGVNTSGRYGLTRVETSLDSAFSQSQSESRSSSIETAREIVTKAVERTFERVRRLRRLTVTEEIRELNRHRLSNAGGTETASPISGIYLWVEKIQKVELRHYGTRMMVEFHVPEPALSLHERAAAREVRKRLPPFDVSPAGIKTTDYMCLAQRYAASGVEPPPTQFIEVGWGWVAKLNEEIEGWGEDQFTDTINIPAGYRPMWAKVAWSGLQGKTENRAFNFAFSVAGASQGFDHAVLTYDGVVLRLAGTADWPQGVPVSGRVHGTWDGAMYVQVKLFCERTEEALNKWRLQTWEALRAGYESLARKLAQDEQQQSFQRNLLGPAIAEGPAAENRRIERAELQKWAIKAMRLSPQNFNAVEQVGEFQEVSPAHAEVQAPIVRFYEDAFEWEHMNYLLFPYHWARRASWPMRNAARAVDPLHRAFLQAGAARVIVPVTPGFEDKVAWFLDPANKTPDELDRILAKPPASPPAPSNDTFRDLWIEVLTDRKPDLARGSGTLDVESGNAGVTINGDSQWRVSKERDLGRELYIGGNRYEVAAVTNDTTFDLDRPFEGTSNPGATYVAGSTPFGPPWTVNVPTSLVVLSENVPALKAV
jgi:hypothetical protein